VKFTNKGGEIIVSAKTKKDNIVEINIKDNGIGMSREMIEGLFHLEVNTSRKGTEGETSTGLGLIICKDFVEKHGGKLRVKSEEGKGSTFYFTIPGKDI
jgi:signal transduction histidine kinase